MTRWLTLWVCLAVLTRSTTVLATCAVGAPYTPALPASNANYATFHANWVSRSALGNIPVLFLGDSITKFWQTYGLSVWTPQWETRLKTTYGLGYTAEAYGYVGDITAGALMRFAGPLTGPVNTTFMQTQVTNLGLTALTSDGVTFDATKWNPYPDSELNIPVGQPYAVVLEFGTNNYAATGAYYCSVDDTVKALHLITNIIHEWLPNTRVIVFGILPHYSNYSLPPMSVYAAFTKGVNAGVRSACHDGFCTVAMDLEADFVDYDIAPNGSTQVKASLYVSGLLHPNAAGYTIISNELDNAIPAAWLSTWLPNQ